MRLSTVADPAIVIPFDLSVVKFDDTFVTAMSTYTAAYIANPSATNYAIKLNRAVL